jgi:hypothetical protein
MTGTEILAFSRGLLDDEKTPYLWSQSFLLTCLNQSIDDFCRKVKCLIDSTTASVCQFYALSDVSLYSVSAKIVDIKSMILASGSSPLVRTSEGQLNLSVSDWRNSTSSYGPTYYIPEAERGKVRIWRPFDDTAVVEGDSNITFTASSKTISKATGGLSVYEAADMINIDGTTSNDGEVTAVTVSDTAIVVSETLTNETLTSATLRLVRDTVNMTVARLPLTHITEATLSTATIEIDELYHLDLVEGVLGYAYLKQDSETYDPKKAMTHMTLFNGHIAQARRDYFQKTSAPDTIGPHRGTT